MEDTRQNRASDEARGALPMVDEIAVLRGVQDLRLGSSLGVDESDFKGESSKSVKSTCRSLKMLCIQKVVDTYVQKFLATDPSLTSCAPALVGAITDTLLTQGYLSFELLERFIGRISLNMSQVKFGLVTQQVLQSVSKLTSLTDLRLRNPAPATRNQFREVFRSGALTHLSTLHFKHTGILDDELLDVVAESSPKIAELDISFSAVTDSSFEITIPIKLLQLKRLDISGIKIESSSLYAIGQHDLKKTIEEIVAKHIPFAESFAIYTFLLDSCPNLKELDLDMIFRNVDGENGPELRGTQLRNINYFLSLDNPISL